MNPTLVLLIEIVAVALVAVVLLFWANRGACDRHFKTQGHKASEFRLIAALMFAIIIGWWAASEGAKLVTTDYGLEAFDLTLKFIAKGELYLTILASVYVAGRSAIKIRKSK